MSFRKYVEREYPDFIIDDSNRDILEKICTQNEKSKGVLLIGGVGCGKTEAMKKVLQYKNIWSATRMYSVVSVRKICFDYQKGGAAAIQGYLDGYVCIDDLGTEIEKVNHYGTGDDVISNLLYLRYEKKIKTYATSNLNPEMLKERYGDRLYDRFKEMFEVVVLEGKSRRK